MGRIKNEKPPNEAFFKFLKEKRESSTPYFYGEGIKFYTHRKNSEIPIEKKERFNLLKWLLSKL